MHPNSIMYCCFRFPGFENETYIFWPWDTPFIPMMNEFKLFTLIVQIQCEITKEMTGSCNFETPHLQILEFTSVRSIRNQRRVKLTSSTLLVCCVVSYFHFSFFENKNHTHIFWSWIGKCFQLWFFSELEYRYINYNL